VKVAWTILAGNDVDGIWRYIAEDNIDAADDVTDMLRRAGDRLAEFPLMGRIGREPGTRELVVAHTAYILIYRVLGQDIEVLRALHGKQDWPPKG
jgi:toxin ParE1/3/4